MAKGISMQVSNISAPNINNSNQFAQKFDKKKLSILACAVGGVALTTAGVLYSVKKGNPQIKLSKFHYNDKQLVLIGAGSVGGGLLGGYLFDDKKNLKYKYKEGMHQFLGNIVTPITVLGISEKILEGTKILNKMKPAAAGITKTLVTIGSLVAGMNLGNFLVKKLTDKIFKEKDERKVKPEDYLVHADDICMVVSHVGKGSLISRIAAHCLPFAFMLSGYKTGIADK